MIILKFPDEVVSQNQNVTYDYLNLERGFDCRQRDELDTRNLDSKPGGFSYFGIKCLIWQFCFIVIQPQTHSRYFVSVVELLVYLSEYSTFLDIWRLKILDMTSCCLLGKPPVMH